MKRGRKVQRLIADIRNALADAALGELLRPHFASWKMMPSVYRVPRTTRLTPCFMLTR